MEITWAFLYTVVHVLFHRYVAALKQKVVVWKGESFNCKFYRNYINCCFFYPFLSHCIFNAKCKECVDKNKIQLRVTDSLTQLKYQLKVFGKNHGCQ